MWQNSQLGGRQAGPYSAPVTFGHASPGQWGTAATVRMRSWLRSAIPNFNATIAVLYNALEMVYDRLSRRSTHAAASVKLQNGIWRQIQDDCFQHVKNALAQAVTLAHPHPYKLLCLFTDASEQHWAGVLTQMPSPDMDLPFEEQRHMPMAFISGSFNGSPSRWSAPEKEGFAIVELVQKLDYLLLRPQGFCLYTDHNNLVLILNPHLEFPPLAKHMVTKIE